MRKRPLAEDEAAHIESELDWFANNLVAPRLNDFHWRALFWFRGETPLVRRAWDLVWPLREHGVAVNMLRSRQPGVIVYQDEHQVAAMPHRRAKNRR